MKIKPNLVALSISLFAWVTPNMMAYSAPATIQKNTQIQLTQLIEQALIFDANRKQLFAQSQAMQDMGIASASLMDPKLKLGVGGIPVDSFKLDQDPMTNISVGLMQQFERGNTQALRRQKAIQQATKITKKIAVRGRDIVNNMTQLWLDLGYQQQAFAILKQNRKLLKELERFVNTNYSLGKSEAQDLLNVQLQISRLNEKIQANEQIQKRIISQFSQWLGADWLRQNKQLKASNHIRWKKLDAMLKKSDGTEHFKFLADNPMVQMVNADILANKTQLEIAKEAYTPQFGVEVMYGFRQAKGMNGQPASDLLSAFLTMDIPLFTDKRQDKSYAAAQYEVGATQYQKEDLLTQMNAKMNALLVERANIQQRIGFYEKTLLEQAKNRTKAVERGYQNNTSQFSDIIDATQDELTLSLERQRLITDLNKVNSNLATLIGAFEHEISYPKTALNIQ